MKFNLLCISLLIPPLLSQCNGGSSGTSDTSGTSDEAQQEAGFFPAGYSQCEIRIPNDEGEIIILFDKSASEDNYGSCSLENLPLNDGSKLPRQEGSWQIQRISSNSSRLILRSSGSPNSMSGTLLFEQQSANEQQGSGSFLDGSQIVINIPTDPQDPISLSGHNFLYIYRP